MRVFVCAGAYIWRPEFHLVSLSLVKGLSLNLELTDSATFAGQQWSAPFCLHPQHQAYRIAPLHTPAFFLGPRNLNLDSQAYTTITLPTEPWFQSLIFTFQYFILLYG